MNPAQSTPSQQKPSFLAHFEQSMAHLRAALTELLNSVGADPSAPQDISRSVGVNRNLAWKLGRLVLSTDPVDAVHHVPRASGLTILLSKFGAKGAPDAVLERVRDAALEFDEMVAEHAGSRTALELMLGSMVPHRVDPLLLESSRKLAFQGQSAIWGVQAKTRFATHLVAPNSDDPNNVDLGVVSGHTEFKRLRPVTRWPLMTEQSWGGRLDQRKWIDPTLSSDSAPFMSDFCTPSMPEVERREQNGATTLELPDGPVGQTAAFTYAFGHVDRAFASIRAGVDDDVAEHSILCDTPSERLVFDLLLHNDLPVDADPKLCVCHAMQQRFPLSADDTYHLPALGETQRLGSGPPLVATPHIPRQHEMLERACEAMGQSLSSFRGYRFTLSFPPVPTRSVFYYSLAPRD